MKRIIWLLSAFIIIFSGCKKQEKTTKQPPAPSIQSLNAQISIVSKKVITKGGKVKINFSSKSKIDSVKIFVDDSLITTAAEQNFSLEIGTEKISHYGLVNIKATAYKGGKEFNFFTKFVLFPSTPPKWYTYRVKKVYPHDPMAYTQGLLYRDGIFYESTGLKGESSIRKVNPQTGQVIQSYTIDPNVFGEGITIWKDKLIQLTWQAHRGFIYDKNTFQKLGEFYYNTEGWGLTNDSTYLIMSDGTNRLYFLNPQNYVVEHTLQVYDNKGPVKLLNELEYINGKIYANIYTTDLIAIINPHSGLVEAYIDMKGLLPASDRKPGTDVLNGIAYDNKGKRLFVTGKNWPKLFWIELIPKK